MEITQTNENKSIICENLLRSLPDWFALEEGIKEYSEGVKETVFFKAEENQRVIGFLSLKKHFKGSYEVYVMAVHSDFHARGIGSKLLSEGEKFLKTQNVRFLQVKTLSQSRPDEFYDKTRAFYIKNNFTPLEEFKSLWDEDNPCLLLIKTL